MKIIQAKRFFLLPTLLLLAACTGSPTAPTAPGEHAMKEAPVPTRIDVPKWSSEALQAALVADPEAASRYRALAADIETIIPRDAIPAIDAPRFWSAAEAEAVYRPDERVIGVDLGGEQRAYSVPFLSGVEVVNDELGGRPISVTW